MSDYEQAVFVSYAWGGDREEIVNQLDNALQKRGLKIIRDKRDLGYKGSIGEFMKRIGQGNCVIIVISDKYLRSPNCMFELVEFADHEQFHDRIFPIVLEDANIYDPVKRIEYIKYWELKRNELAEAMKTLDPANLQGLREDIDLYDRIRDRISELARILKDMNTLTPEMHKLSDFNDLYNAIERKMKSAPLVLSSDAAYDGNSNDAHSSVAYNENLSVSPAAQLTIHGGQPESTEYICYLASDRLASLFDQVDTQTLANPQCQIQTLH